MAFTPDDPWLLPERSDEPPARRRPDFGDALAAIFQGLRENLRMCIGLSLPAAVLLGAANTILKRIEESLDPSTASDQALSDVIVAASATFAGFGTILLVSLLVAPPAYAGLSALGHRAVLDRVGEKPDAVALALSRGPRAIGAFLLVTAAVLAAPAAGLVLAIALTIVSADAAFVAALLLVPGLAVFPGVWLFVRYYLAVPAIAMEDADVSGALRRSAELVQGGWWWLFGLVIVTLVIAAVAGSILALPFGSASGSPVMYGVGQTLSSIVGVSMTGIMLGVAYGVRSTPA